MDEAGTVIEKIYNPSVGKYDVAVTTGPSYMTKRQEAMDAMGQILQANPNLWQVAGDLFVKNMDWPGAQEIAQRLQKMIDPKLLADEEDPALQAANQQMEVMAQEMQMMQQMLQQVQQSMEAREVQIKEFEAQVKAYNAETDRIKAVESGLSEEQVQDIILGTLSGMLASGELVAPNATRETPNEPM
jgi:uncharacterized protein (DUF3084 family)